MLHWFSLVGALSGTAMGQFFYRYYFIKKNFVWLFFAVSFFLMVPLFSYFALKGLSLGVVYMSTGLTQVIILVMSKYFLEEDVGIKKIMSVGIIVFGVVVYAI